MADVNDPLTNIFPDDEASNKAQWLTLPQVPVAAANSIAASFDMVPLEAAPKDAATRL